MKEYGINKLLKKMLIKGAQAAARKDANSTCPFISFQPLVPEEVKKLIKRNDVKDE